MNQFRSVYLLEYHAKFSVPSYCTVPTLHLSLSYCSRLYLTMNRPTLVDLASLYPKRLSRGSSERSVGTTSMMEAAKETRSPLLTSFSTPVGC